jgi:hypothetical protein
MEMINRRFLFLGFALLILMTLCGPGLALPTEIVAKALAQKDVAQRDWAGNDELMMEVVPLMDERGNMPIIISLKKVEYIIAAKPLVELDDAPAGVVLRNWRGFALKGNESHSLRVSIESLTPVEAMNIRKLLASNLTLEEISAEMKKDEGEAINRGALRIGDNIYGLDDILMTSTGNKTVLDANVSELKFGSAQINTTMIVGHLNVTVEEEGGPEASHGLLNINNTKYIGNYRVLLDSKPSGREMRGRGPVNMMPPYGIMVELVQSIL